MSDGHPIDMDRLAAENPGLSQLKLCELAVLGGLVKVHPDAADKQQLAEEAHRVVEVIKTIAEYTVCGLDLVPRDIADAVVDKHVEALGDMSEEDRNFFLYYALRGVELEARALIACHAKEEAA
ncbi:hypothetical protein ACQR1I_14240 [Bradyrhizobium sp. HKCCYLS2038]|uniref:hypothetical protein n=1 Tax=unclassified Bradyrhizobium TaxID=2631580 RepID=UPI003EC0E6ED